MFVALAAVDLLRWGWMCPGPRRRSNGCCAQRSRSCRHAAVFYLADGDVRWMRAVSCVWCTLLRKGNSSLVQRSGLVVRCARGFQWYKRVWVLLNEWLSCPVSAVSRCCCSSSAAAALADHHPPASQPASPARNSPEDEKKKQGQRRSLDTRSAGRRYEGKVRHVGGDDIDSESVGGSVALAGTADCRGPWLHPASNAALVSQTATRPGSTSLARAVESSKRSRAPQTEVVAESSRADAVSRLKSKNKRRRRRRRR